MIWTSVPLKFPDGVDDPRVYGGWVEDATGVRWGKDEPDHPIPAQYIDTVTGLCKVMTKDDDGHWVYDDGEGSVPLADVYLPPPLLLYSPTGELVNPEDAQCPLPTIVSSACGSRPGG